MKLLAIIILSFLIIPKPIDSKLKLEEFVFLEEELPDGCNLKQVINTGNLPCNAQSNPFISSDRIFLDCFIGRLIQDSTLVQNVKRGLFSIYEDKAEIGIFGLETDSEKTAKLILNRLMKKKPNDDSSKLIQSGKIIIWLWKDQGKNSSFDELTKLINARID